MKLEGIVTIAVFVLFMSCKKTESNVDLNEKHKISGVVTIPNGEPLKGVLVTFDDGTDSLEVTTNDSGQYQFEESGSGSIDLYFDGNPYFYLNMRDRKVDFGDFDRTFDKIMVPWHIEENDFLTTSFIDNNEKLFSLVSHNFDALKIQPSDFKYLIGSSYLDDYETKFTSVQSIEEMEITVSFYSMPQNTGYTFENNHTIPYSEVLGWQKILTISTTTTPIGVLEPVIVNLASAYANYPNYDHSGTIIMFSEEINETLGVTSPVDILEIILPYGDDFDLQNQ